MSQHKMLRKSRTKNIVIYICSWNTDWYLTPTSKNRWYKTLYGWVHIFHSFPKHPYHFSSGYKLSYKTFNYEIKNHTYSYLTTLLTLEKWLIICKLTRKIRIRKPKNICFLYKLQNVNRKPFVPRFTFRCMILRCKIYRQVSVGALQSQFLW